MSGWLDSILGRTRPVKAKPERLFAISTAVITLQTRLDLKPGDRSGIVFKPVESTYFETARKEIEDILQVSEQTTGTKYTLQQDEYGYLWAILRDPDFDDLVATTHIISQTLIEHGFGDRLLAAAFPFHDHHPTYWIFNYKRGNFYPFIPTGDKKRDHATELRLKTLLSGEMPIEQEIERWYPLWDAPI